eukprot:NODE_26_length_3432_cov_6254.953887_g5_i3.p1 GENE.NODE_26_length_3432_cov_6254.953887_g5_i3~~NODE_26_length_3432_cov_6254.953887_g5_i3.p1  ORF type:complete len:355 (+),score=65.71 NODE_26_length_3432_cov_6254.953887_g5_i3:2312-3376(+)
MLAFPQLSSLEMSSSRTPSLGAPVAGTYGCKLLTGNANPKLAGAIADNLESKMTLSKVGRFSNGEIQIQVLENIRGQDVFIIQPTCYSAEVQDINAAVMELLLLIHTAKLASAKRITAVIPHFAYARQDRKTEARVPISASAVAHLIMSMGVDRVVTVDLHCGQIQGFFHNTPVDNLYALPVFVAYLRKEHPTLDPKQLAIVSPDAGGVERARMLADNMNAESVVTILKRRVEAGKVDSMQIVGDVTDMDCWLIDDMADTCGTLVAACQLLKKNGARSVSALISHGILTDPACKRINDCDALNLVVTTDTIPQDEHLEKCPKKLKVLSMGPLLAQAIRRIHEEQSMTSLFQTGC